MAEYGVFAGRRCVEPGFFDDRSDAEATAQAFNDWRQPSEQTAHVGEMCECGDAGCECEKGRCDCGEES